MFQIVSHTFGLGLNLDHNILTSASSIAGIRGTCHLPWLVLWDRVCWVIEPGAMWRLQGWGIRSVVLQVILPIIPMVSCFLICGFWECFASHCLWDPVGAFWRLLVFLFQSS
jgi:hypothetical protein